MNMSTKKVWVSFLIIVLLEGWSSEGCWKQERDALLCLKAQFNLPSNWVDGTDCCLWENVECNNTTRRVTKLTFTSFKGSLYLNMSDFLVFEALESLDLSHNAIAGIVTNKGNETFTWPSGLEVLDLSNNQFRNDIISSFSDLKHLKLLDLSNNELGQSMNISGNETLSWPCSLEVLYLSENRFSNDIISSFSELKYLKQFDLSHNKIEGTMDISELYALTRLEILHLSYNNISNFVANQGTKISLSNVKALHLDGCKINGSKLRKSLRIFPSIKELYLTHNEFEGTIVAGDFGELDNLEHLELDSASNIRNDFFKSIGSVISVKILSMESCLISGNLPIEGWSKLKKLEQLYLSYNNFEGPLPFSFANLTSLRILNIDSNSFTKSPAPMLASLTSLESLHCSDNQFDIAASLIFLANYSNLKSFHCVGNEVILDPYPTFQTWVPKFQLQEFRLSSTNESSFLPIPNFLVYQYDLTVVDLSDIKFGGEFPNWLIENNTKLTDLTLSNCFFTGHFQLPLHPIPNISGIDISNNAITGQILEKNISSIFPNLKDLDMSRNKFDGSLSLEFGQMMASLRSLDLSYNNLSGEIPRSVSVDESSLVKLILSNNKFHGSVYPILATLNSMEGLYLDGNNFSGSVESCLCSKSLCGFKNHLTGDTNRRGPVRSGLKSLDMANNNLQGSIPEGLFLWQPFLKYLDLSKNNLSGSLPSLPSYLRFIHLSNNNLSGLTRMMSDVLELLDLSNNDITGHLQDIMGNTPKLNILLLKGNHIMGPIPNDLCELRELAILDLSFNKLSGPIPKCVSEISFHYSRKVDAFNRDDHIGSFYEEEQEVNFTTKRRIETYERGILYNMSGMDLSHNELNGNIPLELGNLTYIRALNLSHNHLSGRIPTTFSCLEQIESLDLSFNELIGEIPPQLIALTFLAVFSLAHNNLSGRTPERKNQFITFDEGSYEGNPFLCGPPLNKSCSSVDKQAGIFPNIDDVDEHEDDGFMDKQFFYISFVVSYASILLVMIIVLYINPRWRRAWFYFMEFIINNCYYFFVVNFCRRFIYINM